jgi:4-hydroxy-2-oxoheptanedioate aldolase
MGHRSFSPWTFTPGVSDSSLYPGDSFNIATSNNHICIFPQIESVKGVENADKIAALDCVSGLMFGPGDFMLDAGIPVSLGGPPHPVLLDAMMKFGEAGIKNGKALMGNAMSMDQIPMLLSSGFRVIGVFMDVWNTALAIKGNVDAAKSHAMEFVGGQETQENGVEGVSAAKEQASVKANDKKELLVNGH